MKILICKDTLNNSILESRVLSETDNIKYEIIEDAPVIENRENEIGHYELGEEGQLIVVYEEKTKSETDILKERVSELEETIMVLSNK